MKIEKVKVEKLIPYARNAKKHNDAQVASIAGSIKEFGFNNPVLIDKECGIIAGHGRVLAAQKLGLKEVPCLRLSHLSENQKRAYVLADNRLAEIGGGWDNEMLKLELEEIDFSGFENFNLDDLGNFDCLDNVLFEKKDNSNFDEKPVRGKIDEFQNKWKVKKGQMWSIGKHFLLCGDSFIEENINKLLNGHEKQTVIFDPEWDKMPPAIKAPNVLAFCDGGTLGNIVEKYGSPTWIFAWDCVTSWYTPNRPLRRMKLCVWYGSIADYKNDGAFYGEPGKEHTVTNTRGSYNYIPDPRGKHLSDLFTMQITKLHSEEEHSHSKPLEWITCLIGNCSSGMIFDPFLGSGTTMVAAQNLNRPCYGMEISPEYCSLILERMSVNFPNLTIKNI